MFLAVGEIRAVLAADETAGFVWIELPTPILHVHSMVLSPGFRGQGTGAAVFGVLEQEFSAVADAIEMGSLV